MELLTDLVRLQTKLQRDKEDLIKKHEEALKDLELRFQLQRTSLSNSVAAELQTQRAAAEDREVEMGFESGHDRHCKRQRKGGETPREEEGGNGRQTTIEELEQELQDMQEDLNMSSDMINALNTKHVSKNGELQEAKKTAVALLKAHTSNDQKKTISVKRAGELQTEAWSGPFEKLSENNKCSWKYHMVQTISELDAKLRSSDFHPCVKVQVGKDEWKEIIDETDAQLVSLHTNYGAEVFDSITDVLKEIMTYNPSGRYVVEVLWNSITNQEATVKDILLQMGEIIKQKDPIRAPARRRTARRKASA